ncbi:DUF4230 domain-containing protein [Sphingomonas sp.]|uniref:DUF4230 domain-containing protein n=1 Tax=Sphingomonas sp. TaxID=28214 RepID=UPI00286CD145|nr:DUF4230 domain-containing protein [Sphingomonas sp.]
MDDPPLIKRDDRKLLIGLAVALLLLLGWFGWQRHKAQQDEYQTSLGLARVLSVTFQARDKLEVGRVDGALDVTTVDPGLFRFLRSAQKATLPYSVAYQLDLSQLDTKDYRWDADKRVLRVTIPDVAATAPNIDETRRKTLATDGMFITREAFDNLNRRAALLATRAASAEAQKPEHLNAARANARKAVANLLKTPLSVAGLGDVTVEVAFPFDAVRSNEQWDVGPSIAEVLAQKQAKN